MARNKGASTKQNKAEFQSAWDAVRAEELVERNLDSALKAMADRLCTEYYPEYDVLGESETSEFFDLMPDGVYQGLLDYVNNPGMYLAKRIFRTVFGTGEITHAIFYECARDDESLAELGQKYRKTWISAVGGRVVDKVFRAAEKHPINELRRLIPSERVAEALTHNRLYRKDAATVYEKIRAMVALREDMVSDMPSNFADFYPLARAIKRKVIFHVGPTNSGKTYEAIQRLAKAGTGVYLAPLRLLAYEKYEELSSLGVRCSMVTGEEIISSPDNTHSSSTVEMADLDTEYEVAVIDEAQMCSDKDRGGAWTKAILGIAAKEVHICLAPEALDTVVKMVKSCRDRIEIINHERKCPLVAEKRAFVYPQDIQDGDALIVFSRRDVHACAADLADKGIQCSVIYGNLPYGVRHEEARKFSAGETKVVVATDAIGMGMNLPIRRIVFLRNEKFDGSNVRSLLPPEIRQIAGRAGRFGQYDTGYYSSTVNPKYITMLYDEESSFEKPVMDIPPVFFEKEGKASEILEAWNLIPAGDMYAKPDIVFKRDLAKELESETDDKQLVLEFISIPFDEGSGVLHSLWKELFRSDLYRTPPDFGYFFEHHDPDNIPAAAKSTGVLEEMYKEYDLLYAYARKHNRKNDMDAIMEIKGKISSKLAEIFEQSTFEKKRCRTCGKKIPWLLPYSECDECHRKRYERWY